MVGGETYVECEYSVWLVLSNTAITIIMILFKEGSDLEKMHHKLVFQTILEKVFQLLLP